MRLIKPVLWMALGTVIGATVVATSSRVQAQQAQRATPRTTDERIVVKPVSGMNLHGLAFVKDIKSGGCWIAVKVNSDLSSLSVAPATACD